MLLGKTNSLMESVVSPDHVDENHLTAVLRYKTTLIQGYYYESDAEQQSHIQAMLEAGWQHSKYSQNVSKSFNDPKYVLYSEYVKEFYT